MSSKFPSELIVDILSYLPVKSLCRFKCVSKSWSVSITHPRFIKLHQARNRRQKFLLVNGESLYHVDPDTSLLHQELSLSYCKVFPNKHDRPFKEEHDHRNFRDCRWVSESSNGLFCVSGSSNGLFCTQMIDPPDLDFFVYNPSTRESKKIPNIDSEKESYHDWMRYPLHGFGYAESIDDYKFVKFFAKRKIIQIFSLRNNSWKTIKCDYPFNVNIVHPIFEFSLYGAVLNGSLHYGIPLNGAIHWMVVVVDYDDRRYYSMVAFDLVEEKFKTLPLHYQFSFKVKRVTVLRDRLCFIDWHNRFWIMEEYGVKESLTRVSIPKKPYPYKCTWKNIGYLFLNLDDDGWLQRDYDSTVFDGIRSYTMHTYVENLVSLNFHRRPRDK
ncbi:hypothetical protein Dsin_024631 [Dipteronia sinensis]|uniref:F-box domain-containing protein n=1 Tax=Dipteronia sinensis TaxID=43782 RepID=A0AAE0DWF2_9ROSI|nr:hypothetical protein Dsin_024631 [Dipteronia sinensis]